MDRLKVDKSSIKEGGASTPTNGAAAASTPARARGGAPALVKGQLEHYRLLKSGGARIDPFPISEKPIGGRERLLGALGVTKSKLYLGDTRNQLRLKSSGSRRDRVQRAVARSLDQIETGGNFNPNRPEGPVTKIRRRGRRHSVIEINHIDDSWRDLPLPKPLQPYADVLKAMPRRKQRSLRPVNIDTPPIGQQLVFDAGLFDVLLRFVVWTRALLVFAVGVFWDKLRGRDNEERRAQKLLHTFQLTGGTLIKIGQQLAMRVDVLPYVYCRELAKLFDTVKPFPVEKAIKSIESSLGMPLQEAFSTFDPIPIGSASIACVYQAVLKSGQKVAVKVRRPDVGRLFAADLKAMKWVLSLSELFAFVRPGLMSNFLLEFESSLCEELDFRKEARYQELFRRFAKKKKLNRRKNWFTAPKVYFELSSSEVLIQEFCTGIWAWEIIAAIEQKDEEILARMRRMNIDAKTVAKRITWSAYWQMMSNFMFHADPHPANIVVKPNNEIVFIDFGACGVLDSAQRDLQEEMNYYQANKDIYGMTQCILTMLEPLPHIDINEFEKELQFVIWGAMCKIWNKKSPWHERTSATIWLSFFDLSRKYQLPVNLDTVRQFRANMLYDSLAIRLCHDLDIYKEYDKFAKDQSSLVAKQFKRKVSDRFQKGLTTEDYTSLARMLATGNQAMYKFRRLMNKKQPNFSYMIEKSVHSVLETIRAVSTGIIVFLVACTTLGARMLVDGGEVRVEQIALAVARSPWFHGALLLILLIYLRRILFRLQDRKVS